MIHCFYLDCPDGYYCPKQGSTDGCVIQKGFYKYLHSGCQFVTSQIAGEEELEVSDCAEMCDGDSGCKGFSLSKMNSATSCVFATTTNCNETNGFIAFTRGRDEGTLLEEPNFPSKLFGFQGCYRKESFRK